MATSAIPPLRYQKGTNGVSPKKATNRPLYELSPMAIRRNSPSFPQARISDIKSDSSPATSPFICANTSSSPHAFWQKRDPTSPSRENQKPTENSPTKRSSIENLKKASRVKNSNIFAKEQQHLYDPTKPKILDGRPLSTQLNGNAYQGRTSDALSNNNALLSSPLNTSVVHYDEPKHAASPDPAPLSPSKLNSSPAKSSLSKRTGTNFRYSSFDPDSEIWDDENDQDKRLPEGRGLHRHAKSVTFDQAPPQVNEYEMTTPVPSSVASGSREGSYESLGDEDEDDMSFERGSSMDHDDSFDASLEDTDKTPVVLPEDWRFMSPDIANTDLAQHEEDVFDNGIGSPEPSAHPGLTLSRPHQISVNSVDSNGQSRPLPPLPPMSATNKISRDSLSGTIERMSSGQRLLPSAPPAASITKSDLRRMSMDSLSLEDRLRLMMINRDRETKFEAEAQLESDHQAESKEDSAVCDLERGSTSLHEQSPAIAPSPRLDRNSILRQLRQTSDSENNDSQHSLHNMSLASWDPDVPMPSLEDPTQTRSLVCETVVTREEVIIKEEPMDEEEVDLYTIPDMYTASADGNSQYDDKEGSQYSAPTKADGINELVEHDVETPRALSPVQPLAEPLKLLQLDEPAVAPQSKTNLPARISLPEFVDFGDESSFNLGFSAYLTPPSELPDTDKPLPAPPAGRFSFSTQPEIVQRPVTPEEQLVLPTLAHSEDNASVEPGTPDSVIRHSISKSPSIGSPPREDLHRHDFLGGPLEHVRNETSAASTKINQPFEIINASRELQPKATSEKRISSLVQLDFPHDSMDLGLGLNLEQDFDRVVETQKVAFELSLQHLYHPFHGRFPSGEVYSSNNIPVEEALQNVASIPTLTGARAPTLSADYPLIPPPLRTRSVANKTSRKQQGYLVRQNTKVVVASERNLPEEPPSLPPPSTETVFDVPDVSVPEPNEVHASTRKASQPTWTAEPWNGKSRRRSIRVGGEKATAKRKPVGGAVPPLPGQPSMVQEDLGPVEEDELAEEDAEDVEEGVERGRLFVKVIGVKDLQLPFPKHERTSFALTLDNGLHCVTTAWLDLAREAPIGQEFELVVLNDLEFQLTLQMKLEEPKVERPASPSKPPPSPTKKQGTFGRLFGSPKKRKDSETRIPQLAEVRRPITPPSAYELVQGLVAKDGSFARAYVSLSEHEKKAYGRPYFVDIKCFNEWALEEVSVGSSRSKKSVTQMQRRPPYEIGKLELQLLYIPKPKGAKDEDMPKSMNSAIRALREAEEKMKQQASIKEFEGYLSQQGGDCPYWRRRFFKLVGSKFTAYHETTRQPRATINLNKASKLIDDKSALTQKETSTKGGGRRKSAFAEEETGYMFVEEGFRIKFANGEVIDFYADSAAGKDEWMQALSQVVGKNISSSSASVKGWTEMVLKREKLLAAKTKSKVPASIPVKEYVEEAIGFAADKPLTAKSSLPVASPITALPQPSAHSRSESYQASGGRSQANSPVKSQVSASERRLKARSMAM